MTVKVRVDVPRSVMVVVSFDGTVKAAIEDDGNPLVYDLEDDECFVRYVADLDAPPIVRRRQRPEGEDRHPTSWRME
jgi:hypothetical protein